MNAREGEEESKGERGRTRESERGGARAEGDSRESVDLPLGTPEHTSLRQGEIGEHGPEGFRHAKALETGTPATSLELHNASTAPRHTGRDRRREGGGEGEEERGGETGEGRQRTPANGGELTPVTRCYSG